MAPPLAPIAWTALRIGAVAAVAYMAARRLQDAPKDVWREHTLDEVGDGLDLSADRAEAERNLHAAGRFRRTVRLGAGPGVEIDLSALARLRLRRVE